MNPLPLHHVILQFFVTLLARRLAYHSIKIYLAGIQFHSSCMGYDIRISDMPQLYYLLRGIRRVQGSSRVQPRRPAISTEHLKHIICYLQTSSISPQDQLMLSSAIMVAFFGLLRSTEYTCSSLHMFMIVLYCFPMFLWIVAVQLFQLG